MEDNPYSMLIYNMRKDQQNKTPIMFREGNIVSTNPLKVEICGTVQQNVFRINADLKDIKAGDKLLMISQEDQQFIILCKVVGV